MKSILVAGAGRIGSFIAQLLAHSGDYGVVLIDNDISHFDNIEPHANLTTLAADISDAKQMRSLHQTHQLCAVVACLPYFCNVRLAEFAKAQGLHYFDLTEDVEVAKTIMGLATDQAQAFVCRCGVAPGFINIVANHLMREFTELDTVKLRGGCLPKHISNTLQYAIAWSIDGLINEYGNICYGIFEKQKVSLQPLDDIETIELDGVTYEAFNTSGGVGALLEMYEGKVNTLNYKTMRYQGHCEKMRFLMQELRLNEDRETLKRILVNALPKTDQDVMILYVSVSGKKNGDFIEQNYVNKIEPVGRFGRHWSAIQVATASAASAVIDIVLGDEGSYQGFVVQETLPLNQILSNRFGQVFAQGEGLTD